jgi:xylulokinase
MGVMLSAAGSLRWFRDAVAGGSSYRELDAAAARVSAGCEGLLFLPYLSGERTPHPDPNARGVFFGLTLRHGRDHMTRAVMEGVSYGLRDSLELMRSLGLPLRQVRASGGGAQSGMWRQILADVFGTTIATVNVTEGAAYGAALLAGVGVGVYRNVPDACRQTVRTGRITRPGNASEVYAGYYPRYRALYPALAGEFAALAKASQ